MIQRAKRAVWILMGLAVLAAIVFGVRSDSLKKHLPWSKAKTAEPRTAKAARGDIEIHFKEAGELAAKVDIQVRPPVDGQVKRVAVEEGDAVKRGQTLAVIQPGKTEAEQKLYVPTAVRSPLDGQVIYLNTNDGDMVTAGKDDFIRVADLKTMIVKLKISEVDVLKLKTGQDAAVTVDALPKESFQGRIYFISPGAIENSKISGYSSESRGPKKFLVKVELAKSGSRLKPGMTARIDLLLDKRAGVLKVPLGAVFEEMGQASAYVKGPAGIEQREVTLGLRNDEEVEVLEGLKAGETALLEKPESPATKVPLPTAKGKPSK
jgi:multidrug efflux pump subunit AcrA (membrane-fusion protein)